MLASMFIGFGVIVAFKTGNFFYLEHSPLTYPMAAITFGAAIILIAYGEGFVYGEYVLLHVRRSAQETKVAGGRQAVDI